MTIKRLTAGLLAALALSVLTGCQLAREDGGEVGGDRLIGLFVTREHLDLFDLEGYLNHNVSGFSGGELQLGGNSAAYEGRLYATLRERTLTDGESGRELVEEIFVFDGVEGISYFAARMPAREGRESYISSSSDDAISDGNFTTSYGDEEDKITLEGTIYVSIPIGEAAFYFNPVYQSADGRVYAMTGSGISMGGTQNEGESCSQTMDAATTVSENGKIKKESTSIKLSVSLLFPPEKIVLLQMDGENTLLSRREYAPGTLPKTLTAEEGTRYFLVESHRRDGEGKPLVTRELFDEGATELLAYAARADGICTKSATTLKW